MVAQAAIRADHRIESDPLGPVEVPRDSLFGPQTERARHNFALTGLPISTMPGLLVALEV
jgi:aspartate ammonia-lyase